MNKRFYTHNDKLYIVLKEVQENKIKNKDGTPNLNFLKILFTVILFIPIRFLIYIFSETNGYCTQ